MSISKIVYIGLFSVAIIIGGIALFKKGKDKKESDQPVADQPKVEEIMIKKERGINVDAKKDSSLTMILPDGDCIAKLFALDSSKLSIVETITYTSRVPWLKGRPAWISDYATHFETSKHFIARGINRKADYFTQKVHPGDRFNVLKKDLSFYLVVDVSISKLWFYAVDGNQERILLKTYSVGLGKKDSAKASKCLTPFGKYSLGKNITVYSPKVMGYFKDQKVEMIRVFGTRWIPFDKEIEGCTEPAKGLGIHGAPWLEDEKTHQLVEERTTIGKYDSDGCIRMLAEDIEEIYAIIATKPTVIEIVPNFQLAHLPSKEDSQKAVATIEQNISK